MINSQRMRFQLEVGKVVRRLEARKLERREARDDISSTAKVKAYTCMGVKTDSPLPTHEGEKYKLQRVRQ